MTHKPAIRQLAADYVDLWEAQIAAAFSHNWAGVLEKATNEHIRRTPGAATDQPAHGDGNVDLDRLARSLATCAERVDAVDAETGRGGGAPDGDIARD